MPRRVGKNSRPPVSAAEPAADPHRLALDETLDLTAATDLTRSLLALRGSELTVDASAVRRVGALCLQVIASAVASWGHDGVALSIASPSPEFMDARRLLGLTAAIPVEEPCP